MAWLIKMPDGQVVDSDDFTLDDLDYIERKSGSAWSVANVYRDAKVARAFLEVGYRRHGLDPADVDRLTLGVIKSVFDFRPDEPLGEAGEGDEEAPLDQSSPGSSSGAAADSTGPRKKSGSKQSGT